MRDNQRTPRERKPHAFGLPRMERNVDRMVERAIDSLVERGCMTRDEAALRLVPDRKEPPMNEQHTDDSAATPGDTIADKAENVLRKRTGGAEEHPVEGHADEAQREMPGETRQPQGTQEGAP